ncbi:amidohydrolase family protein [Paenibacillus sp.]|uniref:amidohydrolase family protein n=1 Tax=Paenibacillus sp. TaxID=58172 RepID=UPI002D356818|nr:amidohydrolase family protein [Paenibacillus sp.]HZG88125.1 amidohydrolase family protein [Paenibacillus sp.]
MIIDCDVHVYPNDGEAIRSRLSQPWKHRFSLRGLLYYKVPAEAAAAAAAQAELGRSPEAMRTGHLEKHGITNALLVPTPHASANHDPDYAAAVASAYNEWLADEWLSKERNPDGAFKGTICVSHQDPAAAAKEIGRWAEHPHMVQVLMESGARAPFGQRHYYPIYEACSAAGLPLVIHPAGEAMGVNKPVWIGYPAHYLEYCASFSFAMQSHLTSLLTEGVFERFPNLRVVIAEGGIFWLAPMLWRLDQNWKALRSEVPWVKKLPSHYVMEHVRFATELDKGPSDAAAWEVLDMADAGRLLMFASNVPDGGPLDMKAALSQIPESRRGRILYDNAKEWYGKRVMALG